MDNLHIRKATESDLPAVLELLSQKDLDDGNVLSIDDANAIFNKFKAYPNYSLYVAAIGTRVVGTFELLVMHNLAHMGKPSGIVEDVIVAAEFRYQGIGRKMMEYAMEVCRESCCYKLTLSSGFLRTQAHQFYEDLGFKRHGYSYSIEV